MHNTNLVLRIVTTKEYMKGQFKRLFGLEGQRGFVSQWFSPSHGTMKWQEIKQYFITSRLTNRGIFFLFILRFLRTIGLFIHTPAGERSP